MRGSPATGGRAGSRVRRSASATPSAGWVPFDNPLAFANRLVPDDPQRHGEVLDTLVVAWRDAWRILRGGPPVSTAIGVKTVRAVDQTIQAAEEARRQEHLRWDVWLQGLYDGTISIPGRADRELADLAGSCDVLGIIVADVDESLGAVLRTAEMGPDRPLAITLITPKGKDADRVTVVERFETACGEAAEGAPLQAMALSPTFDIDGHDDGIITRDRERERFGGRLLRGRSALTSDVMEFFTDVTDRIPYEGPDSDNPLAFRWYDADRVVAGRTMADHLRFAVCYWHSFTWDGFDIFGAGTLDRPWHPTFAPTADPMAAAKQKMDAAFEFFAKLGVPFYCFHDRDIAPEGATSRSRRRNLDEMVDARRRAPAAHRRASCCGAPPTCSPTRASRPARRPIPTPRCSPTPPAQVAHCLEATHRLGGHNYVLWGGREGYETLLNTDMRRELDQLGRFMNMVVEHKQRSVSRARS